MHAGLSVSECRRRACLSKSHVSGCKYGKLQSRYLITHLNSLVSLLSTKPSSTTQTIRTTVDSAPATTDMPRYLRYKAEEKSADDYWDEELERANSILHNRIVRKDRDKLCVDCARFDWLRTHFYTRNCKRQGQHLSHQDLTVKVEDEFLNGPVESGGRPIMLQKTRHLGGIEDDVPWSDFEFVSDDAQEAKDLARRPRFVWSLVPGRETSCSLGDMLLDTFLPLLGSAQPLKPPHSSEFSVRLYRNIFFEQQTGHYCWQVSLSHEIISWSHAQSQFKGPLDAGRTGLEWPSALRADGWRKENGGFSCHIRPLLDDRKHIFGSVPHCCVWQRALSDTVDFGQMAGWLNRCDEEHKHGLTLKKVLNFAAHYIDNSSPWAHRQLQVH
jgi:hypothetical protein